MLARLAPIWLLPRDSNQCATEIADATLQVPALKQQLHGQVLLH